MLAIVAEPPLAQLRPQSSSRLPWGDPDLEGIWTNATLTPLQRAPELGTKEFFTPDEAAAFDKQRIEQTNADRPRGPARLAPTTTHSSSEASKASRAAHVADHRPARRQNSTVHARGAEEGRRASEREARQPRRWPGRSLADRALHPVWRDGADVAGAVQQQLPHHPVSGICDDPRRDESRHARHPARRASTLSQNVHQWTGDSRGRWEGNTLVVETTNLKFNDKSRFGVGYLNGLSDENLRVVERFTRTDANTLTYQATIEDPTVFTKPWTVELSMDRTEGALFEVACHEGNYGMFNILSGHRAEERAATRYAEACASTSGARPPRHTTEHRKS